MSESVKIEGDRRVIAYLHALFSVNGRFDYQALFSRLNDANLYNEFVATTTSCVTRARFQSLAVVLVESYMKQREPFSGNHDYYSRFPRHANHDEWLNAIRAKNLQEISGIPVDYTKEQRRRLMNVDLVPRLLRLFNESVPYFSVSHGGHDIFPKVTFTLPSNVAIVFGKTLGLSDGVDHSTAMKRHFTDPWIVKEYCTNPVWATGSDSKYDDFRNRVYFPPGSTVHEAALVFNDLVYPRLQTGLYAVYDTKYKTKSLPESTPVFRRNRPEDDLNLIQSWFPYRIDTSSNKSLNRVFLSEIVRKMSETGGGIYLPIFCRTNRFSSEYTPRGSKREEKSLIKDRRAHADNLIKKNLGKVYGLPENESSVFMQDQNTLRQVPVNTNYIHTLLRMYHMGPSVSKKAGGFVHDDFRMDKDRSSMYFTRGEGSGLGPQKSRYVVRLPTKHKDTFSRYGRSALVTASRKRKRYVPAHTTEYIDLTLDDDN